MRTQEHQVDEQVAHFLREHPHAASDGPVLVAVSGGVDSMALLTALAHCPLASVQITAVHVHHHLRAAADEDAALVERVCASLHARYLIRHVSLADVPQAERQGAEADARALRYQALASAAAACGARRVYLAHHADDQLETVLWRMLRGSGLTGLAGMLPLRERAGLTFARPLLALPRAAISEYVAEHRIPFVEDESNLDLHHPRNALRHRVLPTLRQIEPALDRHIGTMTAILRAEDNWMHSEALRLIQRSTVQVSGDLLVDLATWREAGLPLQRRAVLLLLYRLGCRHTPFVTVDSITQLLAADSPSAVRMAGSAVRVRREYDRAWFERPGIEPVWRDQVQVGEPQRHTGDMADTGDMAHRDGDRTWVLTDGAQLNWRRPAPYYSWHFHCRALRDGEGYGAAHQRQARLPPVASVTIRTRVPGDRLALLPGPGHKKLQDIFVDAKVPRLLRAHWPVVCVAAVPVWVPQLQRGGTALLSSAGDGWVIEVHPYIES